MAFSKLPKARGFTLLEILLAISLLAMVSVAAFLGLNSIITGKGAIEGSSKRLAAVQRAFMQIQRDLSQMSPRAVRDESGRPLGALIYNPDLGLLEFSRDGWLAPKDGERAAIVRVLYTFGNSTLSRRQFRSLDRAPGGEQPQGRVLLTDIDSFEIRLLDAGGEWRPFWPPGKESVSSPYGFWDRLPRALYFTINIAGLGELRRLFVLPGTG